jgi:large subunit ribosomal protein L30
LSTAMANMLRITLRKSLSGRGRRQMDTARSLGLSRPDRTALHRDTPQIRGMIRRIRHLVSVEEVAAGS